MLTSSSRSTLGTHRTVRQGQKTCPGRPAVGNTEHVDPDTVDEIIDDLQDRLSGAPLHAALREQAAALEPGEAGRAEFLCVLGELLEQDGLVDDARVAFEEALADGGATVLHPLSCLLSVELGLGHEEAATALLTELSARVRAGTLNEETCELVGEALEEHERFREALRWFNIPLRDLDPADLEDLPIGAVHGRFRVRRMLDLPWDRFDDASDAIRSEYLQRHSGG